MPENRQIEMQLPVQLTEAEKARMGRKLAEALGSRKKLEEELAGVKDQYKGRLASSQGEIDRLTSIVADGAEVRPVTCEERKDFDHGEVQTFRTDTGELVDARPMAPGERQLGLQLEAKEGAKAERARAQAEG